MKLDCQNKIPSLKIEYRSILRQSYGIQVTNEIKINDPLQFEVQESHMFNGSLEGSHLQTKRDSQTHLDVVAEKSLKGNSFSKTSE